MKRTSIEYIAAGTKGKLFAEAANGEFHYVDNVVIDSRQAGENTLFFCIIGERTDAHKYLEDVREKGCHAVVVSDEAWAEKMAAHGDMNVFLVEDTTRALMNLAEKYMDDWKDLKKIAVTGSVGKTSTKEFIYSVLSSRYRTGKTPGNLNSEFGIPLTVFGFDEDIEAAVIEVGIGSGPDMADLVQIVKPDAAVITMVGSSHMEYFGSQDKLIDAKLRITSLFGPENLLIANTDCKYTTVESIRSHSSGDFRITTIGRNNDADYRITDVCDEGIDGVKSTLVRDGKAYALKLPVVGVHNLGNAALAVACGEYMGISPEDACEALMNAELSGNRLDILRNDSVTVLNDTYNASPESMKAGIDIIVRSKGERKGAVLGDMGELGSDSLRMHRSVGEYAAEMGLDYLVTIGKSSMEIAAGYINNGSGHVYSYETKDAAIEAIGGIVKPGDVILVKASNAMGLHEVSHAIMKLFN